LVFFLDNLPNREVAGTTGVPFSFTGDRTLTAALTEFVVSPAPFSDLGTAARARVMELYRWEDVAAAYEQLLEGLCSASPRA